MIITLTGLDSGGVNGAEFNLPSAIPPLRAIVNGVLLIQNTTALTGSTGGGGSHTHAETLVIDAGATAVTSTAANGDIIGGSISGTTLTTTQIPAHTHTYANPVYNVVTLDIKTTWPATPDSGDIMLVDGNKIKIYDDLDVEDMIVIDVEPIGLHCRL